MSAVPPPDPDDDRLSAWLDGELTPDEHREVAALLDRSEGWRTALEETAGVRAAVRALPIPEPPPGFPQTMSGHVARRSSRAWPRWAAAGAAAAVVAAVIAMPAERVDSGDPRPRGRPPAEAPDRRAVRGGQLVGDGGAERDEADGAGPLDEVADVLLAPFRW